MRVRRGAGTVAAWSAGGVVLTMTSVRSDAGGLAPGEAPEHPPAAELPRPPGHRIGEGERAGQQLERPGRLRIVAKDGTLSEPLGGVPKVFAQGQGGLLDVTLDPEFATNNVIYLSYAEPGEGGAGTAVARGRLGRSGLDDVKVMAWDNPAQAVIGAVIVGAAIITARSRRRIRAVLLVGVTGYGTALLWSRGVDRLQRWRDDARDAIGSGGVLRRPSLIAALVGVGLLGLSALIFSGDRTPEPQPAAPDPRLAEAPQRPAGETAPEAAPQPPGPAAPEAAPPKSVGATRPPVPEEEPAPDDAPMPGETVTQPGGVSGKAEVIDTATIGS